MTEGSSVSLVTLTAAASLSALGATAATAMWFRSRAAAVAGPSAGSVKCHVSTGSVCSRKKRDPYDPLPRAEYLSWDDYFIALAFLSAQRSKDPNKQVGAVLVSQDNIIVGIGYNGFPRGCPDSKLPWAKRSHDDDILATKYPYVCHAEMNAVLNKNSASLAGAKLYVTMSPCAECAKMLIQAGVKEVIYFEGKDISTKQAAKDYAINCGMRPEESYAAAKRMLAMASVTQRQYFPQHELCICIG